MASYGIHWFRRDLRVAGNSSLLANRKKNSGRVLGVFFFDSEFLSRPDFSHNRFAFFLGTLQSLRDDLRRLGGDLLVLDSRPQPGFSKLIGHLDHGPWGKPSLVSFNRDYEPFARERDSSVHLLIEDELGVEIETERDHLLIEPSELHKPSAPDAHYQVYTPFSRRWFELLQTDQIKGRISEQQRGLKLLKSLGTPKGSVEKLFSLRWDQVFSKHTRSSDFTDQLDHFTEENAKRISVPIPKAGANEALKQLNLFKFKADAYRDQRDYPAVAGTSRLSIFFKNGSITTAQAIAFLGLDNQGFKEKSGRTTFLKELVWREFYYHILYHHPRVEKEAFLTRYKNLEWENRQDYFDAWKEGRTGFPIVDAGMRELRETGWMHNRVRMIVASFLTKDLLIDWRWGEKYFMEALLDGDLAPNNGGWQWAASTGCDPQPYFRIFNPTLQSERFDPDGAYIKKYVPERAHLNGKAIHQPMAPLVDHAARKEQAILMYKKARKP